MKLPKFFWQRMVVAMVTTWPAMAITFYMGYQTCKERCEREVDPTSISQTSIPILPPLPGAKP